MPVKTFDIQEDDLRRMRFDEGMTIKAIAAHYGCATRLINTKMKRFGLLKNKTHDLDAEEVARLYLSGMTMKELEVKFDAPHFTIWKVLDSTGIERRPTNRRFGTFMGPDSPIWRGGIDMMNGYIRIRRYNELVPLHRLVAEYILGRELLPEEVVHHKDQNRCNNAPGNLLVCQNTTEHMKLHAAMRRQPGLDQEAWIAEYRSQRAAA